MADEETPDNPSEAQESERSEAYERHLLRPSEIEEMIQDAMAQGKFDNLSGKGKPLNLRRNPFGEEWDLAHNLLKNNDYTLPWIADRTQLLDRIEALRAEIGARWQHYAAEYLIAPPGAHQLALQTAWYRQLDRWEAAVAKLNQQIDNFNLKRPLPHLELYKLGLDRELERVGARRTLG